MNNIYFLSMYSCDSHLDFIKFNIEHYLGLGIQKENFRIILHGYNKDRLAEGYFICCKYFIPTLTWTEPFNDNVRLYHFAKIMEGLPPDSFVMYADADEFHEYPAAVADIVKECKKRDNIVVIGTTIDRLHENGELPPIDTKQPLFNQFPLKATSCNFLRDKRDFLPKMMIYRAGMMMSRGGHGMILPEPVRFLQGDFKIHHFRWSATTLTKYIQMQKDHSFAERKTDFEQSIVDYINLNGKLKLEDFTLI